MVFIIHMLVSYLKGIDSICSNFRLISVIFILKYRFSLKTSGVNSMQNQITSLQIYFI